MTVKSSISLTDQQDAFARDLVRQGRYSSLSSVVQQALELMRQKTEAEEADILALRTIMEQRLAGEFISSEEMEARVEALIERKRREHGLEN
jgi:antitoxin ParD1/3/4